MIPNFKSLRVLEIGTAVSVPCMGAVLSNLGADVIKIESRKKLDGNRVRIRKGGAGSASGGLNEDDSFPLWHEFNGGKRSVMLNLKSEVSRELFVKLIKQSDLFIQNFAPGWLERLGLGPQTLLELNPRLVMVFASGYGQDGPKAQQRVYAPVMTALGGQEALTGEESGEVQGAMPIAFGDFNAAFNGLLSLFSALYQRETTGRGCMIDLSQIEAVVSTLGEAIVEMQATGKVPVPVGNRSLYRAPHGIYPAGGDDQWITLSIGSDPEWESLVALVRETDPALGEKWAVAAWQHTDGRLKDRTLIDALVAEWTGKFSRDELPAKLQAAGLRSAPVYESDEMEKDDHFLARRFTHDVPHPRLGVMAVTSTPWLFEGFTPAAGTPGPHLGQSSVDVLTTLGGLNEEQIGLYQKEGHFD